MFIAAGIFRIPLWKMLVFDGGAALISVPLWVLAGYFFGEHIPQILEYARHVKEWLFGLVLAAIAGVALSLPAPPQSVAEQLTGARIAHGTGWFPAACFARLPHVQGGEVPAKSLSAGVFEFCILGGIVPRGPPV